MKIKFVMKSALNSAHNFYNKYSCNIAILAETLTIPIFCNPIFWQTAISQTGECPIMPYGQQLSDFHKIYGTTVAHGPPDAVDIKRLLLCSKIALFSALRLP